MLLAALAFASWWTSHTILDAGRTRRVTDAVLENSVVRTYLADRVAAAVAPAVASRNGRPTDQTALATRLEDVLNRSNIRAKLEQFIVDAHDTLIGARTQPAVLDQATVRTLVTAAMPTLTTQELDRIHAVKFDVPRVGALSSSRDALAHRFWLYLVGALVLLVAAFAMSRDRRATLKIVGAWLVGISVVHLFVLWILPVVLLPRFSDNPWANLVSAVARALNAGIVSGLIVLAIAGAACLLVDRLVPAERQ
jgi:hypothetical protein